MHLTSESSEHPDSLHAKPKKLYQHLYIQVLVAIALGVCIGHFWPNFGSALKPLGDAFIKAIKLIIPPVIFLTLTVGLAQLQELRQVGKLMGKCLAYFLSVSTLALIIGLIVVNLFHPGHGMHINPAEIDQSGVKNYIDKAHDESITAFLMNIIPTTLFSPFTSGNILQIIFVAVLLGICLNFSGETGQKLTTLLEMWTKPIFHLVNILMKLAPIGAFGAMAFTIGKYGISALINLAFLVGLFYATCLLFVIVILGAICRYNNFSLLNILRYIKEELLLVLGSSSSESALPSLMQKMEKAGVKKSVVGIVIPTGYSFNLDGTNIYMSLAIVFIAQAMDIDLSLSHQLLILFVAVISSKGAAGVTGSGFIIMAATLSIVPEVPVAGIAIVLGIDRFMSECRSLTNFTGNAIATLVIAKWDKSLDLDKMDEVINRNPRQSKVEERAKDAIAG